MSDVGKPNIKTLDNDELMLELKREYARMVMGGYIPGDGMYRKNLEEEILRRISITKQRMMSSSTKGKKITELLKEGWSYADAKDYAETYYLPEDADEQRN